ncbi:MULTISPECIES: LysR family transcriptional regulator [Dactylosporangium]|uniref:LysR family transcriptional regulator n=2 Tax=Dactylosporangium TaxID=35753 RepID=A0A9W6KR72_9ACTN|nr:MULTISPECIES: LysR family transcriptional regulator [Dactylosporangium]UAB93596.1 LysR family transcriptional regulator [Dactylosporangium vinaceum]UWZ41981.1 LysR family transcriptional regulator [Dactylosporangium matsuzakiense]GLL04940.1 LysR family transcriptional regulator [Dactylosporangium matsuzakiense]
MLDVRRLRLLRDLAQHGTIAAVAAAHTYTPSAVSQQLAVLEREAGVPLLERTGRRVALTPAGRTLVQHAEEVLAALERAAAALAAGRDGLCGPLRIGAFPTAMRTLLPPALVALGEAHPRLELSVHEFDPAVVPHLLRDGTLDVALVHDYDLVPIEPDPALRTVALLDETIYVAAAEARDLPGCRDEPWILASPGTLCHTMTVRACEAAGFIPRVRHHADDFVTVLTFVAAGQGVALVPELAATGVPAGVVLTPLETRRRTRLAFRAGAAQHPAVAAFAEAMGARTDH